jgi:predicted porin
VYCPVFLRKQKMKKIAIAAAMIAASVSAQSQSVTVYGVVDAYAASNSGTNEVGSGGITTSRLGFRGTEVLGNGFSAQFQLEQELNADTGAVGSPQFGRQAWVGLSSYTLGQVRLGRDWTAYDDFASKFNNTANLNAGSANVGAGYTASVGNQIKYISPTMAGVQGSVGYSGSERGTEAKVTSVQATWTRGAVAMGAAAQRDRGTVAESQHSMLGASWDLGAAQLTGTVGSARRGAARDRNMQAGVAVPMGVLTAYAGVARSVTDTAGTRTGSTNAANVLMTYSLSSRTTAYTGYRMVSSKTAGIRSDDKLALIGVRHSF